MDEMRYGDLTFKPYINAEAIAFKLRDLAEEINTNEANSNPVFLVIMTGAYVFAADLLRQINVDCDIRFVRVKSYIGMESAGELRLEEDFLVNLEGRNIILVEDIVDTGNTVHKLIQYLNKMDVISVKTCTLLSKPSAHRLRVNIDYLGFEIEEQFVIGYGLDYNDKARNLPDIWQLAD